MSRHDQTAPTAEFPSQAMIDRAVGRGKSLRSRAMRDAISAVFVPHGARR